MPDRREEGKDPSENLEYGKNEYRLGPDGKLHFQESFRRTPAEGPIQHIRTYLTLIEGEAEAGEFDMAARYWDNMNEWVEKLRAVLNARPR
jgi:hypothetical protein